MMPDASMKIIASGVASRTFFASSDGIASTAFEHPVDLNGRLWLIHQPRKWGRMRQDHVWLFLPWNYIAAVFCQQCMVPHRPWARHRHFYIAVHYESTSCLLYT